MVLVQMLDNEFGFEHQAFEQQETRDWIIFGLEEGIREIRLHNSDFHEHSRVKQFQVRIIIPGYTQDDRSLELLPIFSARDRWPWLALS